MLYPTLEEVKYLIQKKEYGRIPIKKELYADTITPITAIRILKNVSKHCFLLESADTAKRWGRYTFLGFDPSMEITCQNGDIIIKGSVAVNEKTNSPTRDLV